MAKKPSDDDEDFDTFFSRLLDEEIKTRAKEIKPFKHAVFNYSTGLVPFDFMINPSNPGILGGNIIQFAGEGGSGKTTLALNMARDHIEKGHAVQWFDIEAGLTDSIAQSFGITKFGTPNFRYVKLPPGPDLATSYFKLIAASLTKLSGSADPVLYVLDSIPLLRPDVDLDKPPRMGDNIAFFNNFLRVIVPLVGNTNALFVMLNGVYADNTNPWNDYIVSGGFSLKRACQLIVLNYNRAQPKPSSDNKYFIKVGNQEHVYRQYLGIKIIKNKWKHSDPKKDQLNYFFNTDNRYAPFGLDNNHAMLQHLKLTGEIKVGGGGWKLGDRAMPWDDWEHMCATDKDTHNFILNKTLKALQDYYINPIQ